MIKIVYQNILKRVLKYFKINIKILVHYSYRVMEDKHNEK